MELGPQLALYFVAIGLEGALAVRLIRRRLYRRFLAFTVYVCFCAVRSVLLFTLLRISPSAYRGAYWDLRILAILLVACVVGELGGARWWMWTSIAIGVLAAIFTSSLTREFDFVVAAALIFLLGRKGDRALVGVTLGMLVCTLPPAIVSVETLYLAGPFRETFRYVPTLSFIAASLIWLKATSGPRLQLVRGFRRVAA